MKIIVIGGTGTLGSAVVSSLSARHEIIIVAHNSGDIRVDITDNRSVTDMFARIGSFDALIATTGRVHFGPLDEMSAERYQIGLQSKLMGQINLVLSGLPHISHHGSFTLTSGIINHDPIRLGSSAAMVNGAIDGFVKSAAIELPHKIRINSVSPTVLAESLESYGSYFYGFEPVSSARAAQAYVKSVEGAQTGQVYRVG